ncbi:MAG: hypothetical protein ACOZBZ_00915 [Patescibacteria group bacterium]
MFTLLAQKGEELGTLEGLGPLGKTAEFATQFVDKAADLFNKVISNIVGVLTVAAGLWFIFQFIIGAFGWLTAGADKAAVENAQKRIMNAIIGLAIVVAAIFLIDLLGTLMGLKILQPGTFILNIWQTK